MTRARGVSVTAPGRESSSIRVPPIARKMAGGSVPRRRFRIGDAEGDPRLFQGPRQTGGQGGQSLPLPVRSVQHCVCWLACLLACLSTITVVQASPAEPPKTPLRATARNSAHGPSRATAPASWPPASRTVRAAGDPVTSLEKGGAPSRAAVFPLPVPLGDRKSSIWGDPVARR